MSNKTYKSVTTPTGKTGWKKGELIKNIPFAEKGEIMVALEDYSNSNTNLRKYWQSQYLHIVSDENHANGDTLLCNEDGSGIHKWTRDCNEFCRKVIATTNPSLSLPLISSEDVAMWVQKGCPDEVSVEMEDCKKCTYTGNILVCHDNGCQKKTIKLVWDEKKEKPLFNMPTYNMENKEWDIHSIKVGADTYSIGDWVLHSNDRPQDGHDFRIQEFVIKDGDVWAYGHEPNHSRQGICWNYLTKSAENKEQPTQSKMMSVEEWWNKYGDAYVLSNARGVIVSGADAITAYHQYCLSFKDVPQSVDEAIGKEYPDELYADVVNIDLQDYNDMQSKLREAAHFGYSLAKNDVFDWDNMEKKLYSASIVPLSEIGVSKVINWFKSHIQGKTVAVESDAVEFGNWLADNPDIMKTHGIYYLSGVGHQTSEQLYNYWKENVKAK